MNADPRLTDHISHSEISNPVVQLLGFPSDEGVKTNGGRVGAAKAPGLIRKQLLRLTPHPGYVDLHTELLKKCSNAGDLACTGEVAADQNRLGNWVSASLQKPVIPVIIGGGHETSFGHFLGYAKTEKEVTILNIDAHTDVRPLKNGKPHSGSPFRQSMEHPSDVCRSYNVFGLNPAAVSADHCKRVSKQGTACFEKETTRKLILKWLNDHPDGNIMVTMDMDAVNQTEAPGVSAPNASGIRSRLWLDLAFRFGKQKNVTSFDLCEVNPLYDSDHQTVRLAALTLWYFLLGVALRGE